MLEGDYIVRQHRDILCLKLTRRIYCDHEVALFWMFDDCTRVSASTVKAMKYRYGGRSKYCDN